MNGTGTLVAEVILFPVKNESPLCGLLGLPDPTNCPSGFSEASFAGTGMSVGIHGPGNMFIYNVTFGSNTLEPPTPAIPEPSTLLLLLTGAGSAAARRLLQRDTRFTI